jgi:hypothetical protein
VNVLVAEIGSEIDLRVLGTDAIVAATLTADDAHVMSYDIYVGPGDVEGRRVEFAYRNDADSIASPSGCFSTGGCTRSSPRAA